MKPLVRIYSRHKCHLCEVAKSVVESALSEAEFELEIIFIDGDVDLEKLFGEEVPVTMINGKRHDFFTLKKERFIRAINAESKSED